MGLGQKASRTVGMELGMGIREWSWEWGKGDLGVQELQMILGTDLGKSGIWPFRSSRSCWEQTQGKGKLGFGN